MKLQKTEAIYNEVLHAIAASQDDLAVSAPPGSGKTHLAEACAALNRLHLKKSTLIACHTNEQADDLTRRSAQRFPKLPIARLTGSKYQASPDLETLTNVVIGSDVGGTTTITTVAKLIEIQHPPQADLLIVDEAYQMRYCDYQMIRNLAPRAIQIGDFGQIDPIVPIKVEHWAEDPYGPHVPAPKAVLARNEAHHFSLPISRRLCTDSAEILSDAFYPGLPFTGTASPAARYISLPSRATTSVLDKLLDRIAKCGSLCSVILPQRYTPVTDDELIELTVSMIKRLLARKATVRDGRKERLLNPGDIGIVAARNEQVAAMRRALGSLAGQILVETANRFQGLERKVIFALHPISGMVHPTSFDLDPGRLCVSLSRHRVLCILMSRRGVEEALSTYVPEDDRYFGQLDDPTYSGWDVHGRVWRSLVSIKRVIAV